MCKEDLLNKIQETQDEIDKAETAISSAQYELSNLKDELDDLRDEDHHELLTQVHEFITGLEKKTRPCRIKYIAPIYSDDDHEVVVSTDVVYFDWGFQTIIEKIKEVL